MEAHSKRLDHLGIIAGIIKDLKIIELIDERIPPDSRQEISVGEAIAGMIINGLGFSDRPMTLTPQFFQSKAMSRLIREGVTADHFNRHKLGRSLDQCWQYGCDILFAEVSFAVCQQKKVDRRFNSMDTTTFSLTGEYDHAADEHTATVTYGYSKDHRPDLKQVVLEMMVSHDGGIPTASRLWSGNASDAKIFQERARSLVNSFKNSPTPQYLIADCKLYTQETLRGALKDIAFITRVPANLKQEQVVIAEALTTPIPEWIELNEDHQIWVKEIEHYGLKQRWVVVHSQQLKKRSQAALERAVTREKEQLEKELAKLSRKRFFCEEDAKKALIPLNKGKKYHTAILEKIVTEKAYPSKGRPKADAEYKTVYQVQARAEQCDAAIKERAHQKSCYVVATTVPENELSAEEVVRAYKRQNGSIERGFRYLKDPIFFVSSLFIKKPERIQALLMVMTLALLVYGIAQREMRFYLEQKGETLPNQINKEIPNPTLRWVFQMMEGIEYLRVTMNNETKVMILGLTDLRLRILACFPPATRKIYEIAA